MLAPRRIGPSAGLGCGQARAEMRDSLPANERLRKTPHEDMRACLSGKPKRAEADIFLVPEMH